MEVQLSRFEPGIQCVLLRCHVVDHNSKILRSGFDPQFGGWFGLSWYPHKFPFRVAANDSPFCLTTVAASDAEKDKGLFQREEKSYFFNGIQHLADPLNGFLQLCKACKGFPVMKVISEECSKSLDPFSGNLFGHAQEKGVCENHP